MAGTKTPDEDNCGLATVPSTGVFHDVVNIICFIFVNKIVLSLVVLFFDPNISHNITVAVESVHCNACGVIILSLPSSPD